MTFLNTSEKKDATYYWMYLGQDYEWKSDDNGEALSLTYKTNYSLT